MFIKKIFQWRTYYKPLMALKKVVDNQWVTFLWLWKTQSKNLILFPCEKLLIPLCATLIEIYLGPCSTCGLIFCKLSSITSLEVFCWLVCNSMKIILEICKLLIILFSIPSRER